MKKTHSFYCKKLHISSSASEAKFLRNFKLMLLSFQEMAEGKESE